MTSSRLLKTAVAALLAIEGVSGQAPAPATDWDRMKGIQPRGYVCRRAERPIAIDGRLDEPAWRAAPWTDDFVDIEGDAKPEPALPDAGQDALGRPITSTSPPRWRSRTSGAR